LKSAFDKHDKNDDGYLDAHEVDAALRQCGVHFMPDQIEAFIRLGNVTEERTDAGTLSEEEFLAMVRRHRRMGKMKSRTPRVVNSPVRVQQDAPPPSSRGRLPASSPQELKEKRVVAKAARRPSPGGRGVNRNTFHSRAAAASLTPSRMAVGVDLEKRLQDVIGLEPIKDKLRALKDTLVKRRFRKEVGAPLVDVGPLHMVFTGNPGCGKTSIARLLARLLHDLGAVSNARFVEVQRTDLVGAHIGTTGPKTRAKIDEAKGGILFIDEAYRLTSTSEKDFGTEALEEVMSDMTTGDPLIIAAGYPDEMRRFLDANEGLKRRFGHTFDFPDFTVQEIAQMFMHKVHSQGFVLDASVSVEFVAKLIEQRTTSAWRSKINGGVAEKLARSAMQTQDARLDPASLGLEAYRSKASTLEMDDVVKAADLFQYA